MMHSEYNRRRYQYLDRWSFGTASFKVYTIAAGPEFTIYDFALGNAKDYCKSFVLSLGKNFNAKGFIIIHKGVEGFWLLINWWSLEDILFRELAFSPLEKVSFFSRSNEAVLACVYEIRIINHESLSWIRNILEGKRNFGGYLKDQFKDGFY